MKIGNKLRKVCAMALSSCMIISAASSMAITADAANYELALKDSVIFYDANKCGKDAGENNAFDWRGACHVNDGKDVGLDLSGGYHDCGDHVKFGITQGYAASILAWSYYSYADSFDKAGSTAKIEETLRHFCDYFMKCHPNSSTFYYQLGDGGQDHSYWGAPEKQGDRATVFKVGAGSGGADVCGEASAALTITSLCLKGDSAYASKCLKNAKSLYALGKSARGLSSGQGFYTSSSYEDDMAWAAAWLYKATGEASYLSDAKQFLKDSKGNVHRDEWTMCWDNMWTPAEVVMYQLTNDKEYLDAVKYSVDYWINNVPTTAGGMKYLTQWGCLRYSAAQSMIATQYYGLTKDSAAKAFATKQINYILGDNPSGYSYIVGYGNKYPLHPHHRAANGYTYADSGNLKPAKNLLLGALVGGPSTMGDNYADDAQDYTASEVGIDYNAGFVGAVAGLIADGKFSNPIGGTVVVPTKTPTPSTPAPTKTPTPSTPAPSKTPTPTPTPTPTGTPEIVTPTPVTSTQAPQPGTGDSVANVDFNATGSGQVNINCAISAKSGQTVDLSKLTIRFKYSKAGNAAQTFTCDNAGLQLNVAPWYQSLTTDVKATFGDGYVDISFDNATKISGSSALNLGCRMYQSDWSNYSNFKDNGYEVYYDGKLVK